MDGRWHLNKASLRPYASPSGSLHREAAVGSLSTVANAQQTWTTEICNRLGNRSQRGRQHDQYGQAGSESGGEKLSVRHGASAMAGCHGASRWLGFEDEAYKGLQPDKLQRWIRSPSDDRRLMKELLAAYRAQVDVRPEARPVVFPTATGASRWWPRAVRFPRATAATAMPAGARSARRRPRKTAIPSRTRKARRRRRSGEARKTRRRTIPRRRKSGKDKKSHKASSSSLSQRTPCNIRIKPSGNR